MTPKELFEILLSEWLSAYRIYKKNLISNNFPVFEDMLGFYYVNKYYPKNKRGLVFKEMVMEFFYHQQKERDAFYNKYKNIKISHDKYNELHNQSYETGLCFEYLIRYSIFDNADEIIEILKFHSIPHNIEYIDENNVSRLTNINSGFIYIYRIFEIIMYFKAQNNQILPIEIIQKIENFRDLEEVKSFDLHQKAIDDILNLDIIPYSPKIEKDTKSVFINALKTDKKWKWLQEHQLSFIEDKNEFYELVSDLSMINYFDRFEVSEKSINTIKKIKLNAYEAFILDIHAQTNEEAGKRSGWFIGDKVIVYQVFVWILFELKTPNVYSIFTKIAEKCFTKIPSVGPISRKLGDVILKLLYESQTIEGLGTLLKLKSRNKYPVFLEELDKSITKAVRYSKLNPNDVEDYFISDYGLIDGTIEREFGEYKSKLKINDYDDIEVIWTKSDNTLKSEPSAVKSNFGNDLKVWKSTVNDIKKEFSGQKIRFESFWKKKKSWNYDVWKKYFFDHQLLGFLTRKLIWQFENNGETKNGYYIKGQFVDFQNNQLQNIENSKITLWHPALSNVEEVQAWRNFMLSNEIKQPFKQAYREVYIVTGAEINTSTFSNRFNNHVIRHFKFVALAQQRLWHYSQSNVYSREDNPKITYTDYDIKCIFDLESEYDFATTGRIHFWDTENNVALKMEDIPTLIFSETMRDVDLFVGVCSIGAEEQWGNQRFREYWTGYSTSDLSETAQTRKSVIQSIISKLKIKDRCEVTDKYLKVNGKKRVYKIHFGSGNILMEPNDEYLCIIPDPKAAIKDKLFLPFDGDATLSIIISKALLLADDDKITDTVILNQINRK